jgi:hypothetical protein
VVGRATGRFQHPGGINSVREKARRNNVPGFQVFPDEVWFSLNFAQVVKNAA